MTDTIIAQGRGFVIAQTDERETAIPYGPQDREDGNRNYGFIDLRDNVALVSSINEARGRPGMIAILEAANAIGSPLMTLGCERGLFERKANAPGEPTCYYGSYVGLAYRESPANADTQAFVSLARELLRGVEHTDGHYISFEMIVEPLRHFFGDMSRYALTAKIFGYGVDPSSAEAAWEYAAHQIARSIREWTSRVGQR